VLHMVVNTHNAESCAFRDEGNAEVLTKALDELAAAANEHGASIEGTWTNRAAHEVFVLVDAPNGHVIDEMMIGTGLVGRTHTRVVPVVPTRQAIDSVPEDR